MTGLVQHSVCCQQGSGSETHGRNPAACHCNPGNSLVRAGLGVTMLKATLLANFAHGPFLGSARQVAC